MTRLSEAFDLKNEKTNKITTLTQFMPSHMLSAPFESGFNLQITEEIFALLPDEQR